MLRAKGVLVWLAATTLLFGQVNSTAVSAFEASIAQYEKQTRSLRDRIKPTPSVDQIHQHRADLAVSIRNARAGAKQGDIFTPDVAAMFNQLIATTLAGPTGRRIRASLRHAEPVHPIQLEVNGRYPAAVPLQSTPATLLMNLPRLPKGIEYRIVGRTLVLRDAEANTVIDYLPFSMPAPAEKAQ